MSRPDRKYARVYYHDLAAEFPQVWADDAALAAWLRLLAVAESMWPTVPEVPRSVRRKPVALLFEVGLLTHVGTHGYRIRGLDAERKQRQIAAKKAAKGRWSDADRIADGNAGGDLPPHTNNGMPNQTEESTSTKKGSTEALGVFGDFLAAVDPRLQ